MGVVCRCCLSCDEKGESLFTSSKAPLLRHMLSICTGLQFEDARGLPELICEICSRKLHEAFQFRHQCHESDAHLRVQPFKDDNIPIIKPEVYNPIDSPQDENGFDDRETFEYELPLMAIESVQCDKFEPDDDRERKPVKVKKKKSRSDADRNSKKFKILKEQLDTNTADIDNSDRLCHNANFNVDDKLNLENLNLYFIKKEDVEDISNNDSKNVINLPVKKKRIRQGAFICDTCGHKAKQKRDLIVHFRRHTGEKPYKCKTCCKRFATQTALSVHQSQHTGFKSFICDICGKGLSTKETLLAHRRLHTGELPYTCPTCGRAFRAMTNLRSHRKIHTGDKRHSCPECNKLFYTKSDMKNHARRHTGERPYKCQLCAKRFTGSSNYRTHMKIHAGQKDFQCDVCPKTFVSKDSMRRHSRIHTGEREFECKECGRRFAHRSTLVSHQVTHSKTKDYICDICSQSFGYPSGLYVHRKKKHALQSSRIINPNDT